MPRRATVELAPIVAGLAGATDGDGALDEVAAEVLDAAAELIREHGLGRWSLEDVAARSGLGRTTIYRRFEGREHLVHAVITREVRRFFDAVTESVAGVEGVEAKVVEGMLVGLRAARGSVPIGLLRSDPAAVLPLVTTAADPVLDAATAALVAIHATIEPDGPGGDDPAVALVADALVRLSLSYLLTPPTGFDLDDDVEARAALTRLVRPLLAG